MKATLICPSDRTPAAFFARQSPLALAPLLGRSALDRAMARLASEGYKEVTVLAADRPAQVRDALSEGKPWGLKAEVVAVPLEPHHLEGADVFRLDRGFFGKETLLWESAGEWLEEMISSMSIAAQDTIGMRELKPGVWVSTTARLSADAILEGPLWIGRNAWIGANAVIGPRVIVEDGACIDSGAEVRHGFVGPDTYVGSHTELAESLAWGRGLLNWQSGSFTEITDAFLLSDLGTRHRHMVAGSIPERLLALVALAATSPVLAFGWLRCQATGEPVFQPRRAVRAPVQDLSCAGSMVWHELNGVPSMLKRWPVLWSIAKGDFRWIGNRPLTHEEAAQLSNDFERMWLQVPPGLLSLADAEGDGGDLLSDSARAHAAFYAASHGWRADLSILFRWLRLLLKGSPDSTHSTSPIAQT